MEGFEVILPPAATLQKITITRETRHSKPDTERNMNKSTRQSIPMWPKHDTCLVHMGFN